MKDECSIIRDILPLYVEDMVSADTAGFVAEHLEKCDACRAELESMKNSKGLEIVASDAQEDDVSHLKAFKRKWHRQTALIMVACILVTAFLVMVVMKAITGGSYLISGGIVGICFITMLIYLKTPRRSTEANRNVGGLIIFSSRPKIITTLFQQHQFIGTADAE